MVVNIVSENKFPIDVMKFKTVNSTILNFGNVTDNTILALDKVTNELQQMNPPDLIGKLIKSGDRINFEYDGSKYIISVNYNTENLSKIDSELKRIVKV